MLTWKKSFLFVLLWSGLTVLFFTGTIVFSGYLASFLNLLFFEEKEILISLFVFSVLLVWVCLLFLVSEQLALSKLSGSFILCLIPLLVGDVLYFFFQSDPFYGLIMSSTLLAYHLALKTMRKNII